MTERLYYEDPYLLEFEAKVLEVGPATGGAWKVVLDRSAFYPESGGQPADHGFLEAQGVGPLPVTDVQEEGAAVAHFLALPRQEEDEEEKAPPLVAGMQVRGRIDRDRRFDHLQQHAGQHILSAVMVAVAGASTIGFHLSDQSVTIDLDVPVLDGATLEKAEREANRIVFADLPITCAWFTPEEAGRLPLRKPPGAYEKIRVVEVRGFDWSACGGTHPRRAGEIGLIKVLGLEKVRGNVRVAFACGERALREFDLRLQVTRAAGTTLAVPVPDIPAALEKLAVSAREMGKELEKARKELLVHEAEALWREAAEGSAQNGNGDRATNPGALPVVVSKIMTGRDPAEAKALAAAITASHGDTYALLGLETSGQVQIFFARSKDMTVASSPEARSLVTDVLPLLGGRGGGTSLFAQGGGSEVGRLPEALSRAIGLINRAR